MPFFLFALALALPNKNAQDLLKVADEFRAPPGTISFQVNVKDYYHRTLKQENTYRVYSKNATKVLIETLEPSRLSGRKLLMAGSLWLYLPSLRKPTQVSTQGRLTGEVSNGDIARMSFAKDYHAKIVGKDPTSVRLWLSSKTGTAPYRNIRLTLTPQGQPLRAEFYAISGKLLKTCEYSQLSQALGRKILSRLVIKDAVDPKRQSHLFYSLYRKEVLMDAFFDKENLVE